MDDHENEGAWKELPQVFWASAEGDEMTKDEILSMAREADLIDDTSKSDWYVYQLERFAALVAEKEREACAKVCDSIRWSGYTPPEDGAAAEYYDSAASECAEQIMARGNK
jgi:hypothetical protein